VNEDKATRYNRAKRRMAALAASTGAVLLGFFAAAGGSAHLRDFVVTATGAEPDAPSTVAAYVVLLAGPQALLALPFTCAEYELERRYGLAAGTRRDFIRDHLRSAVVHIALALAAAEIVYASMRAWPRWWWAVSAALLTCGMVLLARLAPLVLLPPFYRSRPLVRQALQERLGVLLQRAGVRVLGVHEWALGASTRRANAALVGSGRTRRVLLSDTLLADYSDDEIEAILAHELGHHAQGHMGKALLVQGALLVASLGLAAVALDLLWRPLALRRQSDVAGLPVLVLTAGAFMLCARPAVNLLFRHHERRADRYALVLTDRPAALVSALRRLGVQNLAETNPSTLALWLFHSHPPIDERISAARDYATRSRRDSLPKPSERRSPPSSGGTCRPG
jgi:STE24 endopeptidase